MTQSFWRQHDELPVLKIEGGEKRKHGGSNSLGSKKYKSGDIAGYALEEEGDVSVRYKAIFVRKEDAEAFLSVIEAADPTPGYFSIDKRYYSKGYPAGTPGYVWEIYDDGDPPKLVAVFYERESLKEFYLASTPHRQEKPFAVARS
jgi:hypothetical protein